ncbi:MAG: AAA family ATPase [Thermoguttaceae bacterium]|jgi:ATP-dependent Clp protease ATP-binding subunit ClpA|nr:AAA family ATPase [Thermoguttaceae bacterium]
MPERTFLLRAVLSTLEDGSCLGRLLLFPEVSAYGPDPSKVVKELVRLAERTLGELPLLELHRRRQIGGELEVRDVTVEVPPPPACWWSTLLPVRFGAVCWNHGADASIGYVPALDIEVVVSRPEELDTRIADDIRYTLMRRNTAVSLQALAELQRIESLAVESVACQVPIQSPKQLAQQREPEDEKSVLDEVAGKLTGPRLPRVFGLDAVVESLADWLFGKTPRSVLLVGPSGVGKTAAVHKLASREDPRVPTIRSTSGARLVAGMSGFGMWQERCHQLCREAAQAKAMIHFGNLMELMQVGQSVGSNLGIGEFLRPAISRGELLAIAECTAEELARIERISPAMLDAFVRLDVPEPTPDESLAILSEAAEAYASGTVRRLDRAAIAVVDRLHRRYATYSALPGRPLRFLKNLIADAPEPVGLTPVGSVKLSPVMLMAADVTAAFSRETGLPELLLKETAPLDLPATRNWFQERVIGQAQAVDVVVDLLATVKAVLARPDRPLASLLFIGPTGVGKTEMAKSLAEFLYQDRRRMIRIDMSEYADATSVDRLIGTSCQAEGLLTSKVREQPFAVVLLDEFEKAHPRLYDFLLQALGEGRLTDAAGRLADFRSAVIIMTSNLGADSFGRSAPGFHGAGEPDGAAREHFARHVREFVRPELYNRIDRIVTFLPLAEDILRGIAQRELQLLRQRDGIHCRDLQIEFSPTLVETLVRENCDRRYGARPLKRAVERHVLAPLAAALNERAASVPLHAGVTAGAEGVQVAVRARRGAERRASSQPAAEPTVPANSAEQAVTCRREVMFLANSRGVLDARNELFWLQRADFRHKVRQSRSAAQWDPATIEDQQQAKRREGLQALVDRVDDLAARAAALEEHMLYNFYSGHAPENTADSDLAAVSASVRELALELYAIQAPEPGFVNLVVYGRHLGWLHTLARTYSELALSRGYDVRAHAIRTRQKSAPAPRDAILLGDRDSDDEKQRRQANETRLWAEPLAELRDDLTEGPEKAIGVSLCIRGPHAGLLLRAEEGLHVFRKGGEEARCFVHTGGESMPQYQPPLRIDRRGSIGGQPVRRTYDAQRSTVDDRSLGRQVHWSGDSLPRVLLQLAQTRLEAEVKEWMQPC